jgi:hypothetical protein
MQTPDSEHLHPQLTVFFVDKEKFESPTDSLTVRQILVDYAKEDAATTTLVEKRGDENIKHPDLDEVITIKNGMKFVVFHNSPTSVS